MTSIISTVFFVSILFAVAAFSLAKKHGAKPFVWAGGMLLAWPVLAIVAGLKFRSRHMAVSALAADLAIAVCAVFVSIGFYTAGLEKQSAVNLQELGQALIGYADANDDKLPVSLNDLRPYLTRPPDTKGRSPALISPYQQDLDTVGYRIVILQPALNTASSRPIRLSDVPENACVIEDIYAPAGARIGVFADGSIRSY